MQTSASIEGKKKILDTLVRQIKFAEACNLTVKVGYAAPYATVIHEDLERLHPNGQAKFLEDPMRKLENNGMLQSLITMALKNGKTMEEALMAAGVLIELSSKELVPVQTGFLRDSAFVMVIRDNSEKKH